MRHQTTNKTMNTNKRIIKGHYELELVVGNLYDIHYGINQGVYEYMGQETDGFWKGASSFRNVETNQYFNYFGTSSPYEFTSIVKPHKTF